MYDILDDTQRGFTGQGGQLNIWDDTLNKYVLFIPLETLPSVVGSTNTVENDVTTSTTIGKIKAKRTVDDKDINFLWHRDNLNRLNKFLGKQCKFLVSYPDGTGWKFVSEYNYKPNDSGASDKVQGTLTLISSEVDEVATINVRDLMAKTVTITSVLPSEMTVGTTTKTMTLTANVSGAQFTSTTDSSDIITASVSSNTLTISKGSSAKSGDTSIVTIKATSEGMASWEYTILVTIE